MARKDDEPRNIGEIALDPNRLIHSLSKGISKLPDGVHLFTNEGGVLKPFILPSGKHLDEIGNRAIGVEKQERCARIADAGVINFLTANNASLYLEFDRAGNFKTAHYSDGMHEIPCFNITYQPDTSGQIRAKGSMRLPLVSGISFISPDYEGDERELTCVGVPNLTPEQVRLVFVNGEVPNLNMSEHLLGKLFSRDYFTRYKPPVPQLTFDPHEHAFQASTSRTYLVWDRKNKPQVTIGNTLNGVVLTETDNVPQDGQPFAIRVQINDVKEIPFPYRYGLGTATETNGIITLNDGRTKPQIVQETFVTLGDMKFLADHPQELLGEAYLKLIGKGVGKVHLGSTDSGWGMGDQHNPG